MYNYLIDTVGSSCGDGCIFDMVTRECDCFIKPVIVWVSWRGVSVEGKKHYPLFFVNDDMAKNREIEHEKIFLTTDLKTIFLKDYLYRISNINSSIRIFFNSYDGQDYRILSKEWVFFDYECEDLQD